ncbi:MAG: NAD(P)/FAD-dependent oxidoreductase [Gemmatimonadaceae bacterium]|nr:NAD(P)/FAD-dependent oxidoreductase [Gemmatimonadaceae bacterium]
MTSPVRIPVAHPAPRRPHVVIVGGGFAGLHAARALRDAPVQVTLVDRTNHHLFQPLLYQVATASLSPGDITAPIRWVLRKQRNVFVMLGEVVGIDPASRTISLDSARRSITYDYLVLAPGGRHSYFAHPEWESLAPGLKSVEDAAELRRRFLLSFERAELCEDDAERAAYQTIVIVGGGPTGVELAGAIPDIAHKALRRDFRRIDTRRTRVILLEAGDRVLPAYPESLSERARRDLERLGVEIRLNAFVTEVRDDRVCIGDEMIPTRTVFWAAGNEISPLTKLLGAPLDKAGRVLVEPDLTVPGHPEVFVIGDAAHVVCGGRTVPGVAPAAMQQGRSAGRNIARTLAGKHRVPFDYFNKGDLATIGRHKAVADFGRFRFGGRLAWWLWLTVHIMYLIGFRNRVTVLIEWAYAYFTYQRGVRLITGSERAANRA